MNCKKGDLAIVIIGPHAGVVLTCLAGMRTWIRMPAGSVELKDVWLTDRELEGCAGLKDRYVEDDLLYPIRDPGDDAQDETLQWVPVPSRDEVPA